MGSAGSFIGVIAFYAPAGQNVGLMAIGIRRSIVRHAMLRRAGMLPNYIP
jgi:hypothetical protein